MLAFCDDKNNYCMWMIGICALEKRNMIINIFHVHTHLNQMMPIFLSFF